MNAQISIFRAAEQDAKTVAALACKLWPHHTVLEMEAEFAPLLTGEDAAVFLAFDGKDAIGFAQCQLRRDYVEGCATSPVGYLEGIFVAEEYRRRGTAKALLSACEGWSRERGCREFASDCELGNEESQRFHVSLGFREANRIVCFVREL